MSSSDDYKDSFGFAKLIPGRPNLFPFEAKQMPKLAYNKIANAAREGQLEVVIELSQEVSDNVYLLSEALYQACDKGHLNVVKWLVENTKADINYGVVGLTKQSPLSIAYAHNYSHITSYLVETCKLSNDVKILNIALIVACKEGHLEIIKWLVEHPLIDVNYRAVYEYDPPLLTACTWRHLDVVKYLVEACKADINLPSVDGSTPFTQSLSFFPLSKYLLCEATDLDVNYADSKGNTAMHKTIIAGELIDDFPLHKACYNGKKDEVEKLIDWYDVNEQDIEGFTPLHYACHNGSPDIVKMLMFSIVHHAGVCQSSLTIVNDDGLTPAQLAEKEGNSDLLPLLNAENYTMTILENDQKQMLSKKRAKLLRICSLVRLASQLMMQRVTRRNVFKPLIDNSDEEEMPYSEAELMKTDLDEELMYLMDEKNRARDERKLF